MEPGSSHNNSSSGYSSSSEDFEDYSINEPTNSWGSSCVLYGDAGTPLTISILKQDTKKLKKLTRNPALDPNRAVLYPTVGEDEEIYPLWLAVLCQNCEAVQLLLRHPDISIHQKSWDCGNTGAWYSTPKQLAYHRNMDWALGLITLAENWKTLELLLISKDDENSSLYELFSVEPALSAMIGLKFVKIGYFDKVKEKGKD